MAVYTYDPPERVVAGGVGQPGERSFYLQASGNGRVTSVALEKVQVSRLAERLDELLDDALRNSGGGGARAPARCGGAGQPLGRHARGGGRPPGGGPPPACPTPPRSPCRSSRS